MTKYPVSLIIILGVGEEGLLGKRGSPSRPHTLERRLDMRVMVYRMEEGSLAILIEPGRGQGLPPVYLPEVDPEDLAETVAGELERIARARDLRAN